MDPGNLHITHSHHTNRLPNAETNTRNDATIQAHNTILRVNVPCRIAHRHLRWPIRIHRLALHLHTDNLDGLIPSTKSTTQPTRQDLLQCTQLRTILLACDPPNSLLRQTTKAEP